MATFEFPFVISSHIYVLVHSSFCQSSIKVKKMDGYNKHNGEKGLFPILGGYGGGGGHYPPQHTAYPPQGYGYPPGGYPQAGYPPYGGYPSHGGASGYPPHAYPGSSAPYHSG